MNELLLLVGGVGLLICIGTRVYQPLWRGRIRICFDVISHRGATVAAAAAAATV